MFVAREPLFPPCQEPVPPQIVTRKQLGFTGEYIEFDKSGQAYYHGIPIVSIKPIGDGKGLGDYLVNDQMIDDNFGADGEATGALDFGKWFLNSLCPGGEPDYQITFKPGAYIPPGSPYSGGGGVRVLSGCLSTGQMANQILTAWSLYEMGAGKDRRRHKRMCRISGRSPRCRTRVHSPSRPTRLQFWMRFPRVVSQS